MLGLNHNVLRGKIIVIKNKLVTTDNIITTDIFLSGASIDRIVKLFSVIIDIYQTN